MSNIQSVQQLLYIAHYCVQQFTLASKIQSVQQLLYIAHYCVQQFTLATKYSVHICLQYTCTLVQLSLVDMLPSYLGEPDIALSWYVYGKTSLHQPISQSGAYWNKVALVSFYIDFIYN